MASRWRRLVDALAATPPPYEAGMRYALRSAAADLRDGYGPSVDAATAEALAGWLEDRANQAEPEAASAGGQP